MYALKNDCLHVRIKKTGAELSSIVGNGKEYLWEGNPAYWAGQAPILFPFVGRLKNDTYRYKGQHYSLPQHGFFRRSEDITLLEQSDTRLLFSLKSNPKTRSVFPFEFEFQTAYELQGTKINIQHEVFNLGNDKLWFSLGEHPAFCCSLTDKKVNHDQCFLEFEEKETASTSLLTKEGLIGPEEKEILKQSQFLELPETIFDADALVFQKMNSKKVTLHNRKEGKLVTLAYRDFPYLGIWSKPMAPYVCIEPWLGIADSYDSEQNLENKKGILSLETGKSFRASYSIEVHLKE